MSEVGSDTPPPVERRGLLLVLSSPSGAGKTTIARRLLDSDADISMSVSVTTRTPRPGELEGRDYFFIDEARFHAMREAGDLIEWARVYTNFYGTPRGPVTAALAAGRDLLFDIDWQGAQQLAEQMAPDLVRVFVLPPSGAVLHKRLEGRNQDPPTVVRQRMSEASTEISHWAEYDYVIVNSDIEQSVAGVRAILTAERLKRERQQGLSAFVRDIQKSL